RRDHGRLFTSLSPESRVLSPRRRVLDHVFQQRIANESQITGMAAQFPTAGNEVADDGHGRNRSAGASAGESAVRAAVPGAVYRSFLLEMRMVMCAVTNALPSASRTSTGTTRSNG